MTLRKDEAIAFGVTRMRDVQHVAVERGENVDDREGRPDVANIGSPGLVENDPPHLARNAIPVRRVAPV